MAISEPVSEGASPPLQHDLDDAKWIWTEAARIYGLHNELASLYRAKSDDKRTINRLWDLIEEGEWALKVVGVSL